MPTNDPWSTLISSPFPRDTPSLDPKETATSGGKWGWSETLGNLNQLGTFAFEKGSRAIGRSEQALDPVLGFFRSLLGGDQEKALQLMAPEVGTIVSQYDAGRRAMSEFGGRGGGKNQALAESRFKQAGDIGKLIQGARKDALTGLEKLGGEYAATGTNLLGIGSNADQGIAGLLLDNSKKNAESSRSLGNAIGSFLAMLIGRK